MIKNTIGYSYNDLTILPATISHIKSRSECNCRYEDGMLPIFASPMASVVNCENTNTFRENHITPIVPRNISFSDRLEMMYHGEWIAVSLKEFEEYFITRVENNENDNLTSFEGTCHVCVDIANGHMLSLYEKCHEAKILALKHQYKLTIMTGNIANPETYKWICHFNKLCNTNVIDYIRVGIGGGSGCFVDGTKIKTINGAKNIENISNEDKVLTIDGSYQNVLSTIRYKTDKLLKINNEITSTLNHKFFVINKEDKNKVNEQNLKKYGYWIEAQHLDKNNHLLVKLV